MQTAPHLDNLPPYAPIEPFEVLSARYGRAPHEIIKLDANENPYGPAPRALQALARLEWAHIYPDPESRALRAALADFLGVPMAHILAGAGADELIDLLLRVLLGPGEHVLLAPPTFGMYAFDARLNGGKGIEVPRRPDFSLDLEAMAQAVATYRPKAVLLANPNNPDGGLLDANTLAHLFTWPTLIVLDEAYIEFATAGGQLGEALSCVRVPLERENVVVLRTFSKWAGLAGLRVGYGVFPQWLLPALWKAKQPYNVNVAASAAAIASLEDLDLLAARVACLRRERERLFSLLQTIPYLEPLPSQANFILCRVLDRPARALKEALAAAGIFVRYFDTPYLKNYIRISVGRPEHSDTLIATLRRLGDDSPSP
ncbi:MAG: histidinol-phosphate transaminase [Thermanaerothrix sp.]|nr:histidinol-phosphate transaminase [Thermanaerothrix sp.]